MLARLQNQLGLRVNHVKSAIRALKSRHGSSPKEIKAWLTSKTDFDPSVIQDNIRSVMAAAHKQGSIYRPVKSRYRYRVATASKSTLLLKPKQTVSNKKQKITKMGARKSTKAEKTSSKSRKHTRKVKRTQNGTLQTQMRKKLNRLNSRTILKDFFHPSPKYLAKIGNKSMQSLIDTGASVSILSKKAYQSISRSAPLVPVEEVPALNMLQVNTANGQSLPVMGATVCDVRVRGNNLPRCYFLVGQEPEPHCIIGMNIIRRLPDLSFINGKKKEK